MKSCPACGLPYPDETTFCFLDGQTLRANEDALLGTTVDGLVRLETPFARSGWARTYHGRFRLVSLPCVVKLLDLGASTEGFSAAAAIARRASHDNIYPIVSARLVGRTAVVIRLAAEAQPLALLIERARLDASQAAGLTLQLLAGLARIHDFGGAHGNVRPSNALYWANGHLDLIDAGIGRSLVREPWEDQPDSLAAQHYFAPELSNHLRASVHADLFAVGVIAFELFTGRRPFEGTDVRALRQAIADDATDTLTNALAAIPAPLARFTQRLLAHAPLDRPENGRHAYELLQEACREAGVAPMVDPGRGQVLAATHEFDRGLLRWERYRAIFARMLEVGFPAGAPEQLRTTLQAIAERVERLGGLAKRATFELGNHDDAVGRAHSGRERLAGQIAQATAGGDAIRKAIAEHRAESSRRGELASTFKPEVLERHRAVVQWEGRSGFTEPYRELAAAYRDLAVAVDSWCEAREAQLACEREIEGEREKLHRIESEVDEIRQALAVHESNVGGELDASENALGALGREADGLELELLDLASRFSAPLRSKPELVPAFRELVAAG